MTGGSCKTYENTSKSLKCMPSITFSKPFQWVRLEALLGRFWPLGLIFDTPVLKCCGFRSEGSLFSFPVLRFFQVLFLVFFVF